MTKKLKVITYNIHKGFSPGRVRFGLQKMREALEEVDADLVFLQEVQGEHKRQGKRLREWPDASQFEYLADRLWPHYAYGKNAIYQAGHHGNAILSKYPFVSHENIKVSSVARASRSLLHGVLEISPSAEKVCDLGDEGTVAAKQASEATIQLHVLCIHLGVFKVERTEQLTLLKERIMVHVPDDVPLIIAGDFNDWRKEAVDYLEDELAMKEVFKELHGDYAKTYPALRPTLRNDRIYYRGLALDDGLCLTGKPWRLLSDHLPLEAVFVL